MKAAFYTLGCKVNQTETDAIKSIFATNGYEIVPSSATADVYIVNSCTVTAQGDAKSRRWLNRAKSKNPSAVTVLCGCFPQAFPQKAPTIGADIIAGTLQRANLVTLVEEFLSKRKQIVSLAQHTTGELFEELPYAHSNERTRAFVKIQDGCNRRCAYCIIPTARGNARSRSKESIFNELAALSRDGYREAVFTGINLSSYGVGCDTNLTDLLEGTAKHGSIERIRLSSLEPDLLTGSDITRLAKLPNLCHHFHLSLQSGCAATLRRMRRPYTPAQFSACAAALRSAMPNASLTTDVIVGFPGETDEEFAESLAFVQQMRFLKVHVFPFSAREGTPAATMSEQVPAQEKNRRAAAMQAAADAVRNIWINEQKGTTHKVLLETPLPNGLFTGYTENYIPVNVAAPNNTKGDIVSVRLGDFDGNVCEAAIL